MAKAASQDQLYAQAAHEYGAALERLARAYEADPEIRRDLLQDLHVALFPKGVFAALMLDILVAALFFAVWKMNERAARCLQRKIDELHAAER
ncbi:MAG TPA: hypothetical protein VM715_10085 [Candidatus Acidoferrum sp.]|jgi:hypothetical protein|nr:hypothetical protein [Candidatus Acidoferrum sp.]